MYFYNGAAQPLTEPMEAASSPTYDGDTISLFGDTYPTPVEGTLWANQYSGSGVAASSAFAVGDEDILEFTGLSYSIIQLGVAVDASDMTHLHMDIWTADATEFLIKIVDTTLGYPNNKEGPTTVNETSIPVLNPVLEGPKWLGVDIDLDDLISNTPFASKGHIGEIVIEAVGSTDASVYMDNVYFYTTQPQP